MINDAMLLDEDDEIGWRVAGQRGFRKMRIRANELFRLGVDVSEIAPAAPGDEDFLAGPVGSLENSYPASALASFHRSHEASRTSSEHQHIELTILVRHM